MNKTGIFYAPKGGNTELAAQKIHKHLPEADMLLVSENSIQEMLKYDNLILGIATIGKETWNQDINKNNWDFILPQFENVDFSGKTVALFGLGDSVTYDLHFVDAMGTLARIMRDKGAKLVGFTDTKDYSFRESAAIEDGRFMGLPIDEDFEDEKTDERILLWINDIKKSFS